MDKTEVLEKLRSNLQIAVMIELSTIPPYLCAYWSIHGNSETAKHVKKFILSIVNEEMLHMAMACNILNAVGGAPVLNNPSMHPKFPCTLPGHSMTDNAFIVGLNKCCPSSIQTFLKIEMPEEYYEEKISSDGWCTIGAFYEEIESLINHEALDDTDFNYGRQVSNKYNPAKGVLFKVNSRAEALKALEEIIDQGEGHSGKMYDGDHELTHYWKFKAINDLIQNGIWNYESDVYDMAENPDEKFFTDEAKAVNKTFNRCWTALLNELHEAFNSDSSELDRSISLMFGLAEPAIKLMQMSLVGWNGNAGPTFRFEG